MLNNEKTTETKLPGGPRGPVAPGVPIGPRGPGIPSP